MKQLKTMLNESPVARWTALILISMLMFASYYFYDIYSSLKEVLQNATKLSNSEYGSMYGAYSLLNALGMVFVGGIILDKWGIRKTGTVFISFITIGTLFTAYGATSTFRDGGVGYVFFDSFLREYSPSLKMMIFGRILFGLGAETFYVVINKIIAKWFKGKELALAFAISLALGRLGTACALFFSPMIKDNIGLDNSLWFGYMFIIIAFIAFIVYLMLDVKFDRSKSNESGDGGIEEQFKFSDILILFKNKSFIYITLLCVMFYSAVFPFLGYAPDFLKNKFGFSVNMSGQIAAMLPLGTIIFTPIFGWFTDFKGKNATVMIYGSILLIIVHLTFALTSVNPYISLFLLGIAFSLVPAAMWPSVARIVKESSLGTAYGLMFSIQNWGLMLFPFFIGVVLDKTNKAVPQGGALDYTYSMLMLVLLGVLGLVFAILLKREDKVSGYGLELPNKSDKK